MCSSDDNGKRSVFGAPCPFTVLTHYQNVPELSQSQATEDAFFSFSEFGLLARCVHFLSRKTELGT